jgi:hypothetical protein
MEEGDEVVSVAKLAEREEDESDGVSTDVEEVTPPEEGPTE